MELRTKLEDLQVLFEVDFPYDFLEISNRNLVKADGSHFFSRDEVVELANYLKKHGNGWRLPTLVEMKYIAAYLAYLEECTDGLTGEDFLTAFGEEGYSGKEIIIGKGTAQIRTVYPTTEMSCYWSDPLVAGGCMTITPDGISFDLLSSNQPGSAKAPYIGNFDFDEYPEYNFGRLVRLVRIIPFG